VAGGGVASGVIQRGYNADVRLAVPSPPTTKIRGGGTRHGVMR